MIGDCSVLVRVIWSDDWKPTMVEGKVSDSGEIESPVEGARPMEKLTGAEES